MIAYLVNFTLCSALLLLAYHSLLKNKTTYAFNRFYLLLSIIFSLIVPFIAVKQTVVPLPAIQKPVQQEFDLIPGNTTLYQAPDQSTRATAPAVNHPQINYIPYILLILYSLITLSLLYRFGKNLNTIRLTVLSSKNIGYKNVWLILMNEKLIPHTFLNFIFLNLDDYANGQIEADVMKHEMAHASQYHSADIIFIELIQAVCWFNPLIILYRKAIQLNHEFIADATVLNSNNNVAGYQNLLLSKLGYTKSLAITSQFNYSITKKRIIMMNKTTSAATAFFARLAIIPVLAVAFMLFCTKTEARQEPVTNKQAVKSAPVKAEQNTTQIAKKKRHPIFLLRDYPHTKNGVSEAELKEYVAIAAKYGDPKISMRHPEKISQADKDSMEAIFKQMSYDQQCDQTIGFTYNSPPMAAKQPTQHELDLWKNPKMCGLWIDNKKVENSDLDNYKPADFSLSMVSRLTKNAINYKNYRYQVNLMTVAGYKKYREEAIANRYHSGMYYSSINQPAK